MEGRNFQVLLYPHKLRLPDITWSRSQIDLMLQTINNSNDYLKSIWGEWMKARDKLIIVMMFEHALRPRECLHLRFDDFRAEEHQIRIRGENNKQGKERVMPICDRVRDYAAKYFSFPVWMWKGSSYLFPSSREEKLSTGRWKGIMREKVLKPAGLYITPIKPQFSKTRSYTLRHSRATELINQTKDIYLVANVLGHADISSTTCYLHKNKDYMNYIKEAINF